MALKTNVYISDVTNLTEARYYAGMEVTIIGFNANPTSNSYITATQFDAITAWVSGIQTAWQWNMPLSQEFLDLAVQSPSDFIELNYIPGLSSIQTLKPKLLIRTSSVQELNKITPELAPFIHGIVWEGELSNIPNIENIPVFAQTPNNLNSDTFLSNNPDTGIALKGIPESRPGWNNFDELADLLESLETI